MHSKIDLAQPRSQISTKYFPAELTELKYSARNYDILLKGTALDVAIQLSA